MNKLQDFERKKCNPEMNLKFDETFYKLYNDDLANQFNCTIPFTPSIALNTTKTTLEICRTPEIGEKATSRDSDIKPDTPCARMDIFLGMPVISNGLEIPGGSVPYQGYGYDHTAFIKLYFKTDIKVKNIVWDYDVTTMVAEIGGYTGLLIGFPIVSAIIWIISIILKVVDNKAKMGKFFNLPCKLYYVTHRTRCKK